MIESRACNGLTVKEMSRELRVSRLALERALAAHIGKTPGQMLKEARLARAQELLATTELPIKQIARAVGYVKASNFGDFFRARTGQSPQEYRSARRYETHAPDACSRRACLPSSAENASKLGCYNGLEIGLNRSESRRALPGLGMLGNSPASAVAEQLESSSSGLNPAWLGWDQNTGVDAKSVTILLESRHFAGYYSLDAVSTAAPTEISGEIDA